MSYFDLFALCTMAALYKRSFFMPLTERLAPWSLRFFGCPVCFGFWIGLFYARYHHSDNTLLTCFIVSAGSYIVEHVFGILANFEQKLEIQNSIAIGEANESNRRPEDSSHSQED
jgi:peptidoglycan biosynthesis protein MviN/MurJ (putative lipid II flippase)